MAFLGNFFSGFRSALLKCVRTSVTPKEVSTHYDEKEGPSSDSAENTKEANNIEATQDATGETNSLIDSTDNNNLKQSCLEVISSVSDVPSDFSGSYEKIAYDGASHDDANHPDLVTESIFLSPENRQVIENSAMEDTFQSPEYHHVTGSQHFALEDTFPPKQIPSLTQDQEVLMVDAFNLAEKSLQDSGSQISGNDDEKSFDGVDASGSWTFDVCWKIINLISPFTLSNQPHYIYFGAIPHNQDELEKLTAVAEDYVPPHSEDPLGCAVYAMKQRSYEVAAYHFKHSRSLAVLFNLSSAYHIVERYRFELQRDVGILLPHEDSDANDAIALGYLVAEFVAQFSQVVQKKAEGTPQSNKIRIISHDWSEAIASILLQLWKVETEKVFEPSPSVAALSTNLGHRTKIEQLAREISIKNV